MNMLREFARKDARVKLLERPHRGIVPSANEGVAAAAGEFIARMDSDDIAMPRRLELQVQRMRRDDGIVLLGGNYDLVDAQGRLLRHMDPPDDDAALQRTALAGHTPICQPTAMARRAAVERVGGYDVEFTEGAEDLDLYLRLGEIGRLACVQETLLKYRLHPDSISE